LALAWRVDTDTDAYCHVSRCRTCAAEQTPWPALRILSSHYIYANGDYEWRLTPPSRPKSLPSGFRRSGQVALERP
jgi:hypothetical protein